MILPRKHINLTKSLLGAGSSILSILHSEKNVSAIWEEVKEKKGFNTFENFVLTLDFLFLLGAVEITQEGKIKKQASN